MRLILVGLLAITLVPASRAAAQEPWPITVGLGGGLSGANDFHGLAIVGIQPVRFPIALRLDGLWRPETAGRSNTDLFAALSASAVITLRPWRVAPYLLVGATRVTDYTVPSLVTGQPLYVPARTELTGGLGFGMRVGRGRIFAEMRDLQHAGSPLSIGFTF